MSTTKTGIAWTDATWNPIRGCSRVSEGCRNCYAERVAARFSGPGQPYEGLAKMTPSGPRWTGDVRLVESALDQPLRWKTPRRIFVNSMSDLFHEDVDAADIDRIFDVMMEAEHHTFQVLTKRPARMRDYVTRWLAPALLPAILSRIHLGVSVEDQATADARIPLLLQTPAAVRWVSYEPALGPLSFRWAAWDGKDMGRESVNHLDGLRRLDWIVVGGESGPGARPFHLGWGREMIRQCQEAGVPCFVKQLGTLPYELVGYQDEPILYRNTSPLRYWPDYDGGPVLVTNQPITDPKGADPAEWPADLRVQEWPR